jgi:hypothetical protein
MKKSVLLLVFGLSVLGCNGQTEDEIYIIKSDLRLFTAYAFYNACGFDHDWLDMHPIRVKTRNYLDSILSDDFQKQIKSFSDGKSLGWYEYGAFAINITDPPDFRWMCDTCNLELKQKFIGLDSLLRVFYDEARIDELWDKYKLELDSINNAYKPFARKAISDIIEFTGIESDYYSKQSGKIYFSVCPLMSHWTAFNHSVNNTLHLVQGPSQGEPGPGAFYHEALHPPIAPIIADHPEFYEDLLELNQLAQTRLQGAYPNVVALLNECLVKTIDKYLVGQHYDLSEAKVKELIQNEYNLGYLFCPFFYESIPEYLSSNKTLGEYYPIMMSRLNIEEEVLRWRSNNQNEY